MCRHKEPTHSVFGYDCEKWLQHASRILGKCRVGTGEFDSVVNEYSLDGVNFFVSLIRREYIDMCSCRVLNEHGDCIEDVYFFRKRIE